MITQLSDQISTLNERMDDFTSRIEELNSKIPNRIAASGSQHNLALPMENGNGSLLSLSSSASQLIRESPLMEEVSFENLPFSILFLNWFTPIDSTEHQMLID